MLEEYINRLDKINFDECGNRLIATLLMYFDRDLAYKVMHFYKNHKDDINYNIVKLPKGTPLHRITIDKAHKFKNEPHIPLTHYHNKSSDKDIKNWVKTKSDLILFRVTYNGTTTFNGCQIHYVVPTLLESTKWKTMLNKDLILNKLKDINCVGTMEQINGSEMFEIAIPENFVEPIKEEK